MKYKLLSIILLAAAALTEGCVNDDLEDFREPEQPGQSGESHFQIAVDSFKVNGHSGTRASQPSEKPEPESADEKRINDFWLFQFDAAGNQLKAPAYYELADATQTLNDLTDRAYTELVRNTPMTVYVVTNIGSSTWASGNGFSTLDSVKMQKLPSPSPIQAGVDDVLIPMSGQVDNITVTDKTFVVVPVTRMYAKLKIQASFSVSDMMIYDVNISGIPWYCKVSPMDNGADANGEPAAVPFPDKTTMISRAFQSIEAVKDESGEEWLILYMPENIRGEVEGADKNTSQNVPDSTLTISIRAKYDGMDYYFKVYPGENITNNFNIRRNCVYRVTVDVNSAKDQHNPSSNCFIVNPGDKLAFEPYNRVETGGGFRIEDYLTPDDSTKRIEGVEIVWQTLDCIGDNTAGDRVYLGPQTDPEKFRKIIVKTQKEGNALIAARNKDGEIVWSWHIWVTPNKPDNLANAVTYSTYRWDTTRMTIKVKKDSTWVRDGFITGHWEYTYKDSVVVGIGPVTDEPRIPGYAVMPCNLGALDNIGGTLKHTVEMATKLFSEKEYRTFGMVYQWGRKDPFPPVIRITGGNNDYDSPNRYPGYLDYTTENTGPHYANDNQTEVKKTGNITTGDYLFYSIYSQSISDGIRYAIKNPTVFIAATRDRNISNTRYTENGGDWLPRGESDNKLWGGLDPDPQQQKYMDIGTDADGNEIFVFDNYGDKKSVFDPCPTGWRVAPGNLWLGFTATGLNPNDYGFTANNLPQRGDPHYDDFWNMTDVNWYKDGSGKCGMLMYMQAWRKGPTSYFPLQGTRVGCGWWFNNGWCGNYHNATCSRFNRVNILHMHQNPLRMHIFETTNREYYIKSTASPVRCVRDQK